MKTPSQELRPRPALKVSRVTTVTVTWSIASTVAVRGAEAKIAVSPKASPGPISRRILVPLGVSVVTTQRPSRMT